MSDQPNIDKEDNKLEEKKESGASMTAPKSFFNEWLEKLQQESWQLELLISGLALYLIWETRAKLDKMDVFVALNPGDDLIGRIIEYLQYLAWGAWAIFIINLLIHIAMRGLWIGAIGLRYVSGDIDYKNLHYSEIFEKFLSRRVGRFDNFIEQLERACSVIFAYTFLLFFIFLSILMTILVPIIIIYPFEDLIDNNPDGFIWIGTFIMCYLVLGFLYMIDFITLGGIKKIKDKTISRIYFFIYLGFSIITLSFLYRPLLYNFIDHRYSRRLLWLSFPYFAIVFILAPFLRYNAYAYFPLRYLESANNPYKVIYQDKTINWANYEDLRDKMLAQNPELPAESRMISNVTLPSYYIDDDVTHLFLRITPKDEKLIEKLEKLPQSWKTGLRHPILLSDWKQDTLVTNIRNVYIETEVSLRNEKRKNSDMFTDKVWQEKHDSIDREWDATREQYYQKKMDDVLEAFKNIWVVTIDSIDYNDSLICRYYVHPNLGEKGLMCRMHVGHLPKGENILELKRKRHYTDRDEMSIDTFAIDYIGRIPFFVK